MLKPTVLQKHNLRKMVNGTGHQARRKRSGKYVKKPILDKCQTICLTKKSNEIQAMWKPIKGKYVDNT